MLEIAGRDFLHFAFSGMSQIGKGKGSKKVKRLCGRPIVSIDDLVEERIGMSIGEYTKTFLPSKGFSPEEVWLMFKSIGSEVIFQALIDNMYTPSIFDLGGSDLVHQIYEIQSQRGIRLAKAFANNNLKNLRRYCVVLCVHPYRTKRASVNFFLNGLEDAKWKDSRPPQGDFLTPQEDLAYRADKRHYSYIRNNDVVYFTNGFQANKRDIPTEIVDLFRRSEHEKLELLLRAA